LKGIQQNQGFLGQYTLYRFSKRPTLWNISSQNKVADCKFDIFYGKLGGPVEQCPVVWSAGSAYIKPWKPFHGGGAN
jgi:hypothetical protein